MRLELWLLWFLGFGTFGIAIFIVWVLLTSYAKQDIRLVMIGLFVAGCCMMARNEYLCTAEKETNIHKW